MMRYPNANLHDDAITANFFINYIADARFTIDE
jgi:hypothetical protein